MPAPRPAADAFTLTAAAVACVVATVAFGLYTRTLLPGVDLGDTGGFQAAVLWPETSARRGYPLYYLLAEPFVAALTPAAPARGLNLFSALTAASAVGLLAALAALVTRSVLAGAAGATLLAASYTFWTQAVIAEVYALHLVLIAGCMLALHAFAARPTIGRLAVFFAVYALSFGNHLGMILLLVPFTAFLLYMHPQPRELVTPRIVGIAAAIALAGALQYAPNMAWVWTSIDAPSSWTERVAMFWFDTTKADWRETMVLGVAGDQLAERLAMWWWDSRQQFGIAGMAVALVGAVRLWWLSPPWALLVWLAYLTSTAFAVTYNVGDPHVFFLPGHFVAALAAAAAVAPWPGWRVRFAPRQSSGRPEPRSKGAAPAPHIVFALALLVYGGWRAWETYPVTDRHLDRRADTLVARLATGVDERNAVLLSRLDWESENALLYAARYERRDLAWVRLPRVVPHLPYLVRDNHGIGRDVVLTSEAAADVVMTYGTLYPITRDEVPPAPSLAELVSQIPPGLPYVLTLLDPPSGIRLDEEEFTSALQMLTAGKGSFSQAKYQVWAGRTGAEPVLYRTAEHPFDDRFAILGDAFTLRMDAWLPFDSFRRGGFGHVLRGRERILYIERGVSLVWFRPDGVPVSTYTAGLYAPKPRFRIHATAPQLAELGSYVAR